MSNPPSLTQASTIFGGLLDERYAEGVYHGLLVAREAITKTVGPATAAVLDDAIAYAEEYRQ